MMMMEKKILHSLEEHSEKLDEEDQALEEHSEELDEESQEDQADGKL